VETQLFVCEQLGYLNRETVAAAIARLEETGKMLRGLQKSLKAKL
jgi:hypothetical protein